MREECRDLLEQIAEQTVRINARTAKIKALAAEADTARRNVCDVGAPDMVGAIDLQLAQQIGINPVRRMRLTGPWSLVNRRQPHLRHQPPYTPTVDILADAAQTADHLATAISGHIEKRRVDHPGISASVSWVSGTGA